MIGGSSRSPPCATAVAEALDCELSVPDLLCTAMTAVAEARSDLRGGHGRRAENDIIRVVNTHALGTVTRDQYGKREFSALIKPQPQPASSAAAEEVLPAVQGRVSKLTVEVWEGDDRPVEPPRQRQTHRTRPHLPPQHSRAAEDAGAFDWSTPTARERSAGG
ncbi:hypothetical protein GCM10023238_03150 [Streptomyces heliomycini]